MANWLTTGNTLCYHDRPYSKDMLREDRQVGFAGPELATQFNEIKEEWPEAHWLVVTRPTNEAMEAFRKWGGNDLPALKEFFRERMKLLSEIWLYRTTRLIAAVGLDYLGQAREVWEHLTTEPFDVDRWEILCELNVQQDKEKGRERWLREAQTKEKGELCLGVQ